MSGARQRLRITLATLASISLLLAVVIGYGERAVGNADQFADRATETLRDDAVSTLLARKITDGLILGNRPDLLSGRPLIESAVEGVVGGRTFANLFRAAVKDVHSTVLDRSQDTVTLTVRDLGTVVAAALRKARPELADQLPSEDDIVVLHRRIGEATAETAALLHRMDLLALVFSALALGLGAAALFYVPDRRRTVVALGTGVAITGVVIVVALAVARGIVLARFSTGDDRDAAAAVWGAFLGDLRSVGLLLGGCGGVIAGAAASLVRPRSLSGSLRRAAATVLNEPAQPRWRAIRGAGFLATGVALIFARDAVLALLTTLTAAYLVYEGTRILLWMVQPAEPEVKPDAGADEPSPPVQLPSRRRAMPGAIAAGVVIAAVVSFTTGGGVTAEPPARGDGCNGSPKLCDRPFDQVALAATHNSMAVPLPGWFAAEQDRPIPAQLNEGVRGLLIDTYYGDLLANGRVRTAFASEDEKKRAERDSDLSDESIAAARRLRERAGFRGEGKRGLYMCHGFCELGATPLSDGLRWVREFLVANPDEVLTIVNQDQVSPRSFVDAVRRAGLERYAYDGPVDEWPTLGEMIASGKRLVIFSEHRAGQAPWYRLAYERAVKDTPFGFSSTADLLEPDRLAASCKLERGNPDAPLLLMNHWVSTPPTPRPSVARRVNAYEPLLTRARKCAEMFGSAVNLVAVDFYRRGDVMRVVDTLNGVSKP